MYMMQLELISLLISLMPIISLVLWTDKVENLSSAVILALPAVPAKFLLFVKILSLMTLSMYMK